MKSSKTLFLLLSSFLLSLGGCGDSPFLNDDSGDGQVQAIQGLESKLIFPSSKFKVNAYWREGPRVGDESSLLIILLNQDGTPLSQSMDFRLKLWMPTMGHGSFPVTVTQLTAGVYEATEIFLTMPGTWDIHFQIFQEGNLYEEVIWSLNL